MPKPAMWPIWRNPLAYGTATATRIFLGALVPLTDANHREWPPHDPPGAETAEGEQQEDSKREHFRPEIASIRGRPPTVDACSGRRPVDGPASNTRQKVVPDPQLGWHTRAPPLL